MISEINPEKSSFSETMADMVEILSAGTSLEHVLETFLCFTQEIVPCNQLSISLFNYNVTFFLIKQKGGSRRLAHMNPVALSAETIEKAWGRKPWMEQVEPKKGYFKKQNRDLTSYLYFPLCSGMETLGLIKCKNPVYDGQPATHFPLFQMLCNALVKELVRVMPLYSYKSYQEGRRCFRELVSTASDLFFTMDPSGRITFTNSRIEPLLGYPEEQFVGKEIFCFIDPGRVATVKESMDHLLESGTLQVNRITRMIRSDGQPVDLYLSLTAFYSYAKILEWYGRISPARGELFPLQSQNHQLETSQFIHQELTRIILEGKGMEGITQSVARIMGKPVEVKNRFLDVIAAAKPDNWPDAPSLSGLDDAWETNIFQETLTELGNGLNYARFPAGLMRGMERWRLIAPVNVSGETLGYLSILDCGAEDNQLDPSVIENVVTAMALEMFRQKTAFEVEGKTRGDLLDVIAEGSSSEVILAKARCLGYDLNVITGVLVVEWEQSRAIKTAIEVPRQPGLLYQGIRRLIDEAGLPGVLFIKDDLIVVLLFGDSGSHQRDPLHQAHLLQERLKAFGLGQVSIGVGCTCQGITNLHRSYCEAKQAISIIRIFNARGVIASVKDLGFVGLLSQTADQTELVRFMEQKLGPLKNYDARYKSELLKTLDNYLEHNGSALPTAKASSIHVSTLMYRLRKIEELCQVDMKNPDHLFDFRAALKIEKLRQFSGRPESSNP